MAGSDAGVDAGVDAGNTFTDPGAGAMVLVRWCQCDGTGVMVLV